MRRPSRAQDDMEEAIRRYANLVYRLAFSQARKREDADDIFQEVFLRLVRKNPPFASEEHRKAWLIRVTLNCSRKQWRSQQRKQALPLEESLLAEEPEAVDLHEELMQIPVKYRAVIHLFYYEEMPVSEISAALQRKPSTVRAQLTRARAMLRDILKEEL